MGLAGTGHWSYIKAVVNNPCGANTEISRDIEVAHYDPLVPSLSLTPTSTCGKYIVTATFNAPPPGVSYTWSYSKMPCSTGCPHTGTNAGSWSYILTNNEEIGFSITATDACGESSNGAIYKLNVSGTCSDPYYYLSYEGEVLKQAGPGFPPLNPPDGDLIVMPNPSHKDWIVSLLSNEITHATLTLYDMTGRQVYQQQYDGLSQHDLVVPNQNLPAGSYLLKVKTNLANYQYKLIKN